MRPIRSPLMARAVSSAPNAGSAARRKPAALLASFPTGRNLGMTACLRLRARRAKSTLRTNLLQRGYIVQIGLGRDRFGCDRLLLRLALVHVALCVTERSEETEERGDADRHD